MNSPNGPSRPGEEPHGLIEPDDTESRQLPETAQAMHNIEMVSRRYSGGVGRERRRRTMIYSHDWGVHAGHEHTAEISRDAAHLAAIHTLPRGRAVGAAAGAIGDGGVAAGAPRCFKEDLPAAVH